jgi:hypothetical protein
MQQISTGAKLLSLLILLLYLAGMLGTLPVCLWLLPHIQLLREARPFAALSLLFLALGGPTLIGVFLSSALLIACRRARTPGLARAADQVVNHLASGFPTLRSNHRKQN